MKRLLVFIVVIAVPFVFGGCYDMTEIEDIETVFAVCAEDGKITYCTVTASSDKKDYGFELYPVETEDLYKGLNSVSLKTGKEVSVSHLGVIVFKTGSSPTLIRSVCESAIRGSEFHPKVLTAFVDMEISDFFEKMTVSEDTVMYRKLTDVLDDRYASVTKSTVMDLYHGIMQRSLGVNIPVITLDGDGNIVTDGSCHVSGDRIMYINQNLTDTVNLLKNSGKPVYFTLSGGSVAAKVTGGSAEFDRNGNHISISTEIDISGQYVNKDTRAELEDRIRSDVVRIVNEKNNGFDILGLNREMRRAFFTEGEFLDFCNSKGGFEGMLRELNFDITLREGNT